MCVWLGERVPLTATYVLAGTRDAGIRVIWVKVICAEMAICMTDQVLASFVLCVKEWLDLDLGSQRPGMG